MLFYEIASLTVLIVGGSAAGPPIAFTTLQAPSSYGARGINSRGCPCDLDAM